MDQMCEPSGSNAGSAVARETRELVLRHCTIAFGQSSEMAVPARAIEEGVPLGWKVADRCAETSTTSCTRLAENATGFTRGAVLRTFSPDSAREEGSGASSPVSHTVCRAKKLPGRIGGVEHAGTLVDGRRLKTQRGVGPVIAEIVRHVSETESVSATEANQCCERHSRLKLPVNALRPSRAGTII